MDFAQVSISSSSGGRIHEWLRRRRSSLSTRAGAWVTAWLANPLLHTLEVLRRVEEHWVTLHAFHDDQEVRAEPFEAIVLEFSALWADVRL